MTERLSELLHDQAQDLPVPGTPAGAILSRGRQARRRRRLGGAAASAVAVAAVATLAVSLAGVGGVGGQSVQPATAPTTTSDTGPAALLEACRTGNQSESETRAIFGSGTPIIKGSVHTDFQTKLALESADGAHWADCFVYPRGADSEFASGMTVSTTAGSEDDLFSYSSGGGCHGADAEDAATCRTFQVAWVDRRPKEVAAAVVETADGRSTTVPSKDGYFVFNYIGALPDGIVPSDRDDRWMEFRPLHRVTFLDADGNAIAAQAMDGSGAGPDGERIGRLPTLVAYPRQGEPLGDL